MANATVSNIAPGSVPYDHAHESSALMFDVLTLIYAATDLNENGENLTDIGGLTDDKSRITNLLIQARDKAVAAIKRLDV